MLPLVVSCIKPEEFVEDFNGEITFKPEMSTMTKAGEGQSDAYPDNQTFALFAYHQETPGGQWKSFIDKAEFHKEDGVWCGKDQAYYWPLSGTLAFAGYSPYSTGGISTSETISFSPSTRDMVVKDFINDGSRDLMFFLPQVDGDIVGVSKTSSSVPVQFHHALSMLSFNITAKDEDKSKIKLKRITLKGVYTQGTFTVNASDVSAGTWNLYATSTKDVTIFSDADGVQLLSARSCDYFAMPASPCEMEVVYEDGILEGGIDEKAYPVLLADHTDGNWLTGKKYVYNISLSVGLEPVIIDKSKVSVSIEHIYQSGTTLAGSRVNLNLDLVNLGLTSEQLARIKNFTVSVQKNGVTYKQKTFDSISNSLSITEGDKFYLPKGTFDVVCTYNDGIEDRSLTLTASAPAPEYDLYLDFIAGSNGVTMYSASVNISENVLGEVELSSSDQYNSSMVRFAGQTTARFATGDCDLDSPQFLKDARKSGKPYTNGYYSFYNTVLFDGIAPENTHYSLFNKIETWTTPYKVHSIKLNKIQYAQEHMQDGDMYVICATQNTQRYWYVDGNGNLKLSTSAPDHSNIAKEYIFRYDYADQNVGQENGYNQYSSVGTWYSCYTGKYMNKDTDPVFNQSDPSLYVKCATGWGDNKRDGPVDMMKGYKQLLRYGYSVDKAYWSGTEAPDQYWKWDLYEVVIE